MLKNYLIVIGIGLITIAMPDFVYAQSEKIEVSGIVTDASDENPLPGVNVAIKGTSQGTSTDAEGAYTLRASSASDTLTFSFIGYQTREVPVQGREVIDIEMTSQAITGEEVVVVGYGQQSRKSLTGSVSSVTNEDIRKSPAVNVGNALTGKVTGLQVIQSSGQPGGDAPQLFMRGVGSLSTGRSAPLVLVDGVERDMFQLEPDNIANISVLKDAAATAVYGVRGANGVIVVETKRGRKGPMKVSAKLSSGFQQPTNLQEFVDSYTYAKLFNEAQLGDGIPSSQLRFSEEAIEAFRTNSDPLIYPNTDWVEYITKPAAFQTRNSISISGGTDDVKYFVSGGYLKQEGLFRTFNSEYDFNPSFSKYNFRTNLDIDATSSTRISLTGYGRVESRIRTRGDANRWRNIYRGGPFAGSGIVDGKLVTTGYGDNKRYIPGNKLDPLLRYFGQGYNEFVKNVLNVDLGVTQKLNFITDGLSFKVKGSYNTIFTQNKRRNASQVYYLAYYRTDVDPSAPGDSSIVFRKIGTEGTLGYSENYGRDRKWYVEARLEYNQDFGRHNVKGLLLYNQRKDYYPNELRGIPRGLVSTVGRINYNYDDRYLLEANMGYNGSENFARERRFGFFPSISGGWIVTNESFMEDVTFLDFLKFRASYGLVGNDQGIGRFLYLQDSYNASVDGYNFGVEVPQLTPGATEDRLGNPLVTWETAKKQNYGMNVRFLQSRLSLGFDYFYEYREDILTSLNTVPAYVAADLPAVNVGEVENKGYEVELKWRQQVGNDFFYHIGANVSFARNKIVDMDEVLQNEPYLHRTGHPVDQVFGYVFDSFFTEDDLLPDSGVPEHPYNAVPGDLQFEDLNGDGVINEDDQKSIGYPEYPEYTFGSTMGFQYKNFDVTMVWAGAANVSRLLRYEPYRHEFGGGGAWSLMKWHAEDRWTPEKGEDAIFPRLSTNIGQRYNNMDSDFWMRDASYLRLKNVEIGYNFSPGFLQGIGLRNMRIYVNGYNLLTFSKLNSINLDPEETTFPLNSAYPVVKVYNFGVNIDF